MNLSKIETEVYDAVRWNKPFVGGNTKIMPAFGSGLLCVFLHDSRIITTDKKCFLIDSHGFITGVTRSRLNAVLYALDYYDKVCIRKGAFVWSKSGEPVVNGVKYVVIKESK